ncbi:MAG TPA: hypothetical protein VK604_19815 [Bryobacteraceae bacterium]|nr:hypothetical protein [Bryobacteraceae bacterium]
MLQTRFHNRRAVQLENGLIRVSVTVEGGHIAEILEKNSGVNPLWTPPWPSMEPSQYSAAEHPEYGNDAESVLLSGIMGHNVCLDLFGPPSETEAAAGLKVHGEAGIVVHDVLLDGDCLVAGCTLPIAQLAFERRIKLAGRRVLISETLENLSALDRPIAWTQHVTLGPPFLERGKTQFRAPGVPEDLQVFTSAESSAGYTAHLLSRAADQAWFFAWSPVSNICLGYVWNRLDFPWLGIWEENHSRTSAPWNTRTLTCGMEFGVSPFPEPRRKMIERSTWLNTPCYRWIGAKSKLNVEYAAAIAPASVIPQSLDQFEELVSVE